MDIGGISHNLHSYTPVRRPETTISARQLHGDQEKEWTAARCHRLLRALTSRVAILTKDIARFQQQNTGDSVSSNSQDRVGSMKHNGKASDEDWLKAKKRVIRTYSAKGRKATNGQGAHAVKGRNSILPGEVLVPTPVLARARGQYSIKEAIPGSNNVELDQQGAKVKRRRTCYGGNNTNVEFQLSGTLREIRNATTATRYSTYEGIYNGLETLLRATKQSSAKSESKGAKSLLSMALRAIPSYINEQEALLQAHMEETGSKSAIENRDITVEVYDDLEAYGSSGYGWKRLSVIVRAHGVQVVSDAISLGVLDMDFCGVLISLCIHMGAIDEGQALLSALLSSSRFSRPKTLNDQISKPLSMLWKFTQHTSRASFQLKEMSRLILENRLPLEWLATKDFGQFWSRLIQCLTPDAWDDDVLGFMEILLLELLDFSSTVKPPFNTIADAVRNTFSSLLTTLCSIVLLSRETAEQVAVGIVPQVSQLTALLAACVHQSHAKPKPSNVSYLLLLLAYVLVEDEQSENHESEDIVEEISKLLRRKQDQTTNCAQAAMFICQVARCCGRGTLGFGFQHLHQLHLRLEVLACGQEQNSVIKGLVVDSAFAFARKEPDRQHIDYAASMDATYCTRSVEVETSLLEMSDSDNDENKSGLRWEEGIGEWVTATPGTSSTKWASMIEIESDEDSPFRPPPNLRRRVEHTPSAVTRSVLYSDNIDELEGPNEDDHKPMSTPNCKEIIEILSDSEEEPSLLQDVQSESGDELGSISPESSIYDDQDNYQNHVSMDDTNNQSNEGETEEDESDQSGSDMEENTDKIELSFCDESIVSIESTEKGSSPAPKLPQSARRIISRTSRLTRKLFQNHQSYQLFNSSDQSVSSASSNNNSPMNRREFIDRAPRLGRRALRSGQAWEVFEESDDELSFLSVSSSFTSLASQKGQALQEITNKYKSEKESKPITRKQEARILTRKRIALQMSESEDELCI